MQDIIPPHMTTEQAQIFIETEARVQRQVQAARIAGYADALYEQSKIWAMMPWWQRVMFAVKGTLP